MSVLVVVAFAIISVIACAVTWFFTRANAETRASVALDALAKRMDTYWQRRLDEVNAENAPLRERNEMLVGLVGADVEQAALHGACADEAEGWVQ